LIRMDRCFNLYVIIFPSSVILKIGNAYMYFGHIFFGLKHTLPPRSSVRKFIFIWQKRRRNNFDFLGSTNFFVYPWYYLFRVLISFLCTVFINDKNLENYGIGSVYCTVYFKIFRFLCSTRKFLLVHVDLGTGTSFLNIFPSERLLCGFCM
jgi:hypothetical protein